MNYFSFKIFDGVLGITWYPDVLEIDCCYGVSNSYK